mmetsp:Transcript_15064/g.41902  ORF Transcript_15064/g.41902 Transcript_15064/m.41902 type:complete len:112 (-) Transcript_15064:116-451(-)
MMKYTKRERERILITTTAQESSDLDLLSKAPKHDSLHIPMKIDKKVINRRLQKHNTCMTRTSYYRCALFHEKIQEACWWCSVLSTTTSKNKANNLNSSKKVRSNVHSLCNN